MSYTIIDVVKDLFTGKLAFASKSVRIGRRVLCSNCDARDPTLNVCTACGCYIPAKTRLKKSECPMGLW